MRLKIALAGLMVVVGAAALAVAQTAAPKDPPLIDIQGFQDILEKYKGQPLVVTMWATWCEPCRDEYPLVNELAKQYGPQGLRVVGISMDQDGDLILMRRFLARYKPVFPNYRKKKGDEDAFTQVVMPGWNGSLPATFFYGRDGKQVGHLLGAGTREGFEAEIKAVVEK
jgi:thiol-disulfide isomerase/thioredoxin